MRVVKLKDLSQNDYQRIAQRSAGGFRKIMPSVRKIMEKIKKDGDKAIYEKYQEKYGKENYQSVAVSKEELRQAYKNVTGEFITAIRQMIRNITIVHKAQLTKRKSAVVSPQDGIAVWRVWRAIEKVGLYIPGGKAIYPSSVLMSAIPAKIAGCKEIIMCSPPRENGQIPYATLVAGDQLGIHNIFKVGGAEAVAAMVYGTKSIPHVYKIFGAGNSYVTAAKMIALEKIGIDMPAGPSEIFIIADETANPKYIAADLLADGEHGPDSACVLLTVSEKVAQDTVREIEKELRTLPTANNARESLEKYGLIAIVDTIEEAIDFTNGYAPEHLEIMMKRPGQIVTKINNAGSVFLGNWTTKSSGDYATGANHVLPTGGMAKMYPPLGVDSFGKWMQVQECTKAGLSRMKVTIETIAEIEQLPAHKNSTSVRFQ